MHIQFDFHGKLAVVTGASGAIGAAIAKEFHRAGAHVVATGRNRHALDSLRDSLGERCDLVIGDMADAAHRQAIIDRAIERGGIDVLVNNAGMTQTKKPTEEGTLADFDEIISVNLRAMYALSLDVMRGWVSRGHAGVVVNVSSPGAQRAHRNNAIYDISKGGVDAMTRCLAVDFGRHGIRVNAIAPAQIPHSHTKHVDPAAASGLPLPRHGLAEEAARPVLFLASSAASFITGHVLPVDGGLLAQLRMPAVG
ncbi:SDR family NAD(P)-dependent oxidoreductase [Ralstonia flatus]|uniref:Gluconate 5-dehydrogenase n=1 Tax=Ralstonia flatus TaxID=3058601 RepID=A0AAD2C1K8_9RALS|nr:SDR family oxidoreductase [Ralstonia sp. LMG 32965]MBN6209244.1 SDR family oxidoreductase [Ralstonia pickettii]CAJ0858010.1 Gluconate 5-dehydrogenase [Ralstonia sp. LMG 32965]CAJ0861855.1 Gluconate 5-dehydrogenase [Ralstonia sp. LMG 32965]